MFNFTEFITFSGSQIKLLSSLKDNCYLNVPMVFRGQSQTHSVRVFGLVSLYDIFVFMFVLVGVPLDVGTCFVVSIRIVSTQSRLPFTQVGEASNCFPSAFSLFPKLDVFSLYFSFQQPKYFEANMHSNQFLNF